MKRIMHETESYYVNKHHRRKRRRRNHNHRHDSDSDSRTSSGSDSEGGEESDGGTVHTHKDETGVYMRDNHIYFRSGVSTNSVYKLDKLILKYNKKFDKVKKNNYLGYLEPKPLYLHITSPGGDLLAGFFATDSIKNSKVPIHTIVESYACSAGSIMAVVGKVRYMTENSHILIHQLSSFAVGTFENLKDDSVNNENFMERLKKLYLSHTKITKEKLTDVLKHDFYWDSKTCLEVGLVDKIYTGEETR